MDKELGKNVKKELKCRKSTNVGEKSCERRLSGEGKPSKEHGDERVVISPPTTA